MRSRTLSIVVEHCAVPGRLRLRCATLATNRQARAHVRRALQAVPDFERVEIRAHTGSIVLGYSSAVPWPEMARLAQDAISGRLPAREAARPASAEAEPVPRRSARPPADSAAVTNWHSLSADRVVAELKTDASDGLSDAEATARLLREGGNFLPTEEPRSRMSMFLKQFNSLPVALLAGSSAVSLATGRVTDAISTLAVVGANAVLGHVTEGQAESAIRALMDTSTQEVNVIRGGRLCRVRSKDIVPGDLCLVRPGEQIAADARLVAERGLRIDESALTGETLPVGKSAVANLGPEVPIGARPTMIHAGTLVAEGHGRAIVVATGRHTEAARIALLSQAADRPQAPVETELDDLGRILVKLSLAACGVFFGIGWLRGYAVAQILQDSLALAVAAVPEGLPVVATSTMALGLRRMERKAILVRQVQAIESLGALQTVCLDKTGTLTENRMTVVAAAAGSRSVDPTDQVALEPLIRAAVLNNDAEAVDCAAAGSSPTERALIEFGLQSGLDVAALRKARPRERIIERGPDRAWMATVHGGRGSKTMVKGAPSDVLALCTRVFEGGRSRALTEKDRARIRKLNAEMAALPARVLGFAQGRTAPDGEVLDELTWLGLVGMVDPLRPGARRFVASMRQAGIDTVIISGDQAATAGALARQLGLGQDGTVRVIDSTELAGLDPRLLAELASRTDVFARVSAYQKLAIVQALQASGRVVGMTGDGVNDGPALKAANVGIAMGASGTDLARDVANVVIRNDELDTLSDAIAEGRTVYRNIRRALGFLITTNMSEILVEIIEAIHGPGELETPMELLWINIATDVLPGLGLAIADPDPDVMLQPPRDPSEPIVPAEDFRRMALDGSTIAVSALASHFVGLARYGPGPKTRGMTFLTLSMGQLMYTLFSQRRDLRELRPGKLLENRVLDGAVLASMGLAVLPFFAPPLRRLLGVAPLGPVDTAVALAAAALPGAAVLARRGIQIEIEELEAGPCETS